MEATPRRRLRWYQYSLRSLFVLTVLVAIGGSGFAWKKRQVERERTAVREIVALGGVAEYDYQFDALGARTFDGTPPGPTWLGHLLGEDSSAHVVRVNLDRLSVTDAQLQHLSGLSQLRILRLSSTGITDGGLENIKGLTQLHNLNLAGTHVTDAGLEHLKGLSQLETLYLYDTPVTDVGLEHLKGLSHLKEVFLSGTKVTAEGAKTLRQALPLCAIW